MSQTRTLPAVTALPGRSNIRGLRVVEEPARGGFRSWNEGRQTLAPLPVRSSVEPSVKLEAVMNRELPPLVPLDLEQVTGAAHPWAVRNVVDFFRLFLPELSLTIAGVIGSGVLAVKMAQRLVSPVEARWVTAAYALLLVIDLGGFYLAARRQAYPLNKMRAQRRLLFTVLLFFPHLMGYSLLNALK